MKVQRNESNFFNVDSEAKHQQLFILRERGKYDKSFRFLA